MLRTLLPRYFKVSRASFQQQRQRNEHDFDLRHLGHFIGKFEKFKIIFKIEISVTLRHNDCLVHDKAMENGKLYSVLLVYKSYSGWSSYQWKKHFFYSNRANAQLLCQQHQQFRSLATCTNDKSVHITFKKSCISARFVGFIFFIVSLSLISARLAQKIQNN